MVCIIDDREDVWNFAPNLVHVKPYSFFKNTGDINAPPGSKEHKRAQEELEKDSGDWLGITIGAPTADFDESNMVSREMIEELAAYCAAED